MMGLTVQVVLGPGHWQSKTLAYFKKVPGGLGYGYNVSRVFAGTETSAALSDTGQVTGTDSQTRSPPAGLLPLPTQLESHVQHRTCLLPVTTGMRALCHSSGGHWCAL